MEEVRNWFENLKGRDHLEDLGVDGKIILKWMLRKQGGREGVDWIHLIYDMDHWQAVVNTVMNLRFP
jgi:hypothetical protein